MEWLATKDLIERNHIYCLSHAPKTKNHKDARFVPICHHCAVKGHIRPHYRKLHAPSTSHTHTQCILIVMTNICLHVTFVEWRVISDLIVLNCVDTLMIHPHIIILIKMEIGIIVLVGVGIEFKYLDIRWLPMKRMRMRMWCLNMCIKCWKIQ